MLICQVHSSFTLAQFHTCIFQGTHTALEFLFFKWGYQHKSQHSADYLQTAIYEVLLFLSLTRAVLRELDIQEMEWLAVCPNLHPIEHVWDRFNRRVCGRPVPLQTLQDLKQALIEEWNLIPQHDIH